MHAVRFHLIPLLVALVALPVDASGCVPGTSAPDVDVVGIYYVFQDPAQVECCPVGSWWIYEESNGIDGAQRQDEIVDDTCGGQIPGDTIAF